LGTVLGTVQLKVISPSITKTACKIKEELKFNSNLASIDTSLIKNKK